MKNKVFKYLTANIILVVMCSFISLQKVHAIDEVKLPLIFPAPQNISVEDGSFDLSEKTIVIVPRNPSEGDLHLAQFLVNELSDKFGLALRIEKLSNIPSNRQFILIGSINNPLVKVYCNQHKLNVTAKDPGSEGYVLKVSENSVIVAGSDQQGAFYGLQSLRQIIKKDDEIKIQCVDVRDWPNMPFRGIKLYIPGRENIPFFKRFIKDFMALYKFNKVIIEVNGVMRLDRHPEVNAGWVEFAQDLDFSRRNNVLGPKGYYQNSNHRDAGDGGILEKQEVRDLVEFSEDHYIEVIPEIATLTHSYYLLTRHRELADVKDSEWPSTYCPSNPDTYKLLFDVFDEYIEVMKPKMINIGRDEWWGSPIDYCPLCKGKDYSALFAEDLNKIHSYLAKKRIKTAMWGDHLLENVRKKGYIDRTFHTGEKYKTPGALPLSMVKEKIPKDILIFNWFYSDQSNELLLEQLGFKQIYANFTPNILNWDERTKLKSILGGAPSSWAATTEFNFGKDLTGFFLGCSSLLWSSKKSLEPNDLYATIQNLMPQVRMALDGKIQPSELNDPIVPLKLDAFLNTSSEELLQGVDLSSLKSGRVNAGKKVFDIINFSAKSDKILLTAGTEGEKKIPVVREVKGIQVNEDITSLLFLHACAYPSSNEKAYRKIYNFYDSSDLLGWYEIVYEDGFIETIPIRYGYNILEWNVIKSENYKDLTGRGQGSSQNRYCYAADPVDCSSDMRENPITFFAFEWVNKRLGKSIKEINLKGTTNFINTQNKVINKNAIMLMGLSVVKSRAIPGTRD